MTHYEICKARVLGYAQFAWAAVRDGRLNESAVEGLVRSYLQQPAFYASWREPLLKLAMEKRDDGLPAEERNHLGL